LCGDVNSRNAYGGYVGFRKFMAQAAGYVIEGENADSWWGGNDKPTDQIIYELQIQIDYAKEVLERQRTTGKKINSATFDREFDREKQARIFSALWHTNCR
jgi:hypothetical protein